MVYKILKRPNIDQLIIEVNEYLNNGWDLQGGVSFSIDEKHDEKYIQAIIKNIKKGKDSNDRKK